MVKINENKCVGCGICEQLCPKVFEIGSDGKAQVKSSATEEDKKAKCVKDAKEQCPAQAIS